MAGLTDAGLQIKRLAEIRTDLANRIAAYTGRPIDIDRARSVVSIVVGAVSVLAAEAWLALQQVYDARRPGTATGQAADDVSEFVGIYRERGFRAEAILDLVGTAGVTIPAGKLARSSVTGRVFELVESVTLSGGGTGSGRFVAEEIGVVAETAGSVTEIVTPSAGWTSVTNPLDIAGGADPESDEALLLKRQSSLAIVGSATDLAIAAKIRALDFVLDARVISNRKIETVDGRPGKSFEAVVWPASGSPPLDADEEEEIAALIWRNQPSGIEAFGDEVHTVTDIAGREHEVGFSYVDEAEVYADVVVVYDASYAGDSSLKAALAAAGNAMATVGLDLWVVDYLAVVRDLPGVLGASLRLGLAPAPTETIRVVISDTQIGRFDTTRIAVTSTGA